MVWMRWGRVGKCGQTSTEHCGADLNRAKSIFSKKFYDKTQNHWEDKDAFEKCAGKYDLVVKDYDADEPDPSEAVKAEAKEEKAEVPPMPAT